MEWSMLIQSPTDWGILFLSALIIGMSKTGIQGLSLISVPLLALAFGAKPSTGLILPILCIADLIAVLYYRRIAEWKYVFKLLPAALVGFILALLVDKVIPPAAFKHLMGGCLAIVLLVMFWSEWKGKENKLSSCWWYGPFFGLLGGFTTMIGNAAGPVMAIYLLSVKMPKYSFCRDKRMVLSCNQLSEDSGTDVCMEQYNESITHNRCPYYPLYTNGRCSRHLF